MNVSPAKENILKKIRKALSNSTPLPFPQSEGSSNVYQPSQQDLGLEFAQRFTNLKGKFVFCENTSELVSQLNQVITVNKWDKIFCKEEGLRKTLAENKFDNYSHNDLPTCDTAITSCEWLVARTGSIVMSTAQESGRTVSVYAPVHICVAYTSQLVYDVKDALLKAREKYSGNFPSLITFATGPSRTADIEKTLVVGVHGPKEVYVFLVDQ
ncbi:MAG TPA: LUD domain-containing protein [Niastella sp.]